VFLAGVGDLVVMRPLRHVREQPEDSLLHLLALVDFTVGNLEVPLTTADSPQRTDIALRGEPALISDVVALGLDAVSLANNHAGDHGWDALREMAEELELAGLVTLGVGADLEAAFQPQLQNVDGVDVAFVTATCVGFERYLAASGRGGMAGVRIRTEYEADAARLEWEPATPPRTVTTFDAGDLGRLLRAVEKAREMARLVVVVMHWGVSWADRPAAYQRELGRALVEAGASTVLGAHSHTLQGVELHRGAPIFHGLGSFVFNYEGPVAERMPRDTAVALLEVTGDGRVAGVRLVLGRLDAGGEPVRAHPERAELMAETLARNSAGWGAPFRLANDTLEFRLD
jgi:poly-gamma-glutamate synthesis protein (capsule biosynthesis protein)